MSNKLKIDAVVTSVDIGTPIALNTTPLLGGAGREAKYSIPVLPLTSTVKLQGASKVSSDGLASHVPDEDSTDWTDLLTITSASDHEGEIADLPDYIRWNTTVLDADGPNVAIFLEGVQ